MAVMIAHAPGTRAQQGFVLSGRGEWGAARDRQHHGQQTQGSNASNNLYQLSLRGPIGYGIRVSTSGAFSKWLQDSRSDGVPNHVGRTGSLSNSLYVPLTRGFSLTVRQSQISTEGTSANRRRSLGGTLTGRAFESGPDLSLQVDQVSQSETIAGQAKTTENLHQNLKLSRVSKTFLYHLEQTMNRQQVTGRGDFTTTWSSNLRLLKWLSTKSRTSGAYSITKTPSTLSMAGNVSFSHELSRRRSFDLGLNYSDSRGSDSDTIPSQRTSIGGSASGRSTQSLGWGIDHISTLKALALAQRSSVLGDDLSGSISLDNNLQRPIGHWDVGVGSSASIEASQSGTDGIGTRITATVSAVRTGRHGQFRTSYALDRERTDLEQTRHAVKIESRRYLRRTISVFANADANHSETHTADTNTVSVTRQFSLQEGIEFRGRLRSLSVTHQFYSTRSGSLYTRRHNSSASLTWPLWDGARLDAQGQMQFEDTRDLRNLTAQLSITWPVASLELSAISRFHNTRSESTHHSGSYVGFKVGRSFQKAW